MTITFRKTLFLAIIASLALILSACKPGEIDQFIPGGTENNGNETDETQLPASSVSAVTIEYTDSGFEPDSVTVNAGEAINWVNNSSRTVQVGSDNHPTHKINQEITGGEFVVELAVGESSTVTLNDVGSWGYHDHLRPALTGEIVVQ